MIVMLEFRGIGEFFVVCQRLTAPPIILFFFNFLFLCFSKCHTDDLIILKNFLSSSSDLIPYYSTPSTPRTSSTTTQIYLMQHMQQSALDTSFLLV